MVLSNGLWDKFANYENFLLAWQRTVNVTSRMFHEKLGMKIFEYNLQSNLEDLVQQVNLKDFPYSPLADHKVYVPKPSTTLRTMSLMAVPACQNYPMGHLGLILALIGREPVFKTTIQSL